MADTSGGGGPEGGRLRLLFDKVTEPVVRSLTQFSRGFALGLELFVSEPSESGEVDETAERRHKRLHIWSVCGAALGIIGGLLLLVAAVKHRWSVWPTLAALAVFGYGLWALQQLTIENRDKSEGRPGGRLVLEGIAALIGVYCVLSTDAFYFAGLVLLLLGATALVSEWRWRQGRTWPLVPLTMFSVAVLLLVSAYLLPGQLVAIGIALLLAMVTTELVSERTQKWTFAVQARRTVVPAGAGLLLLGAVVLFLVFVVDIPWQYVCALVALVFVLVLFTAADSDALIFVLAGALVLMWANTPSDGEEIPLPSKGSKDWFLVLGDSYISGEGARTFAPGTNTTDRDEILWDAPWDDPQGIHTQVPTAENECRRSTSAWPFLIADSTLWEDPLDVEGLGLPKVPDLPDEVLFEACSGAQTENIHTEPRRASGSGNPSGPAELALVRHHMDELKLDDPAFVLISIGGNDAGFGDLGSTCIGPGDCTQVGDQLLVDTRRSREDQLVDGEPGPGGAEALRFIDDDLDAAYARINRLFDDDGDGLSEVAVIVTPYPSPVDEERDCLVPLTREERQFINHFVDELNGVIKAAADRAGFLFMDNLIGALHDDGLGVVDQRLCSDSLFAEGINFIKPEASTSGTTRDLLNPSHWIHNSLHPNEDGHFALALAARDWFAAHASVKDGKLVFEQQRPNPNAAHDVQTVEQLMGRPIEQCGESVNCLVAGHRWLLSEAHKAYKFMLPVLALLAFGSWLVVMPALWLGRQFGDAAPRQGAAGVVPFVRPVIAWWRVQKTYFELVRKLVSGELPKTTTKGTTQASTDVVDEPDAHEGAGHDDLGEQQPD